MTISKYKIWLRFFFKSFIWALLPLCIWGDVKSCTNYIEAGEHLTPYSVSVRGYYRKDGTYVNPYQRRPPGGAKHDAPYESERTNMGFLFFLSSIGGVISIFVYVGMSVAEIRRQKKLLEEIEQKRYEEAKSSFISLILKEIDFDFSKLSNKPLRLERGSGSKCKFCKKHISNNDFQISFVAVSHIHFVCISCVKNRESLGRGHSRSNYINEINFHENYKSLLNDFKLRFDNKASAGEFKFKDFELKNIFDSQIFK